MSHCSAVGDVLVDRPRVGRSRALIALDTEDDSKGTLRMVNFFDGREHATFTGKWMRDSAWQYLEARGPADVWACQTEYDLVNLYGPEILGRMVTLQYVRSGFMRGTSRHSQTTFFDTLRHWPATVKAMGQVIGLPKLDPPPGFEHATLTELRPYCRRDTEIVWRYVDAMLDRYDGLGLALRPTLPGMALQFFNKRFKARATYQLPDDVLDFLRSGYYGGRVEVYRLGTVAGPIRHYDVNSLFPSVMQGRLYPVINDRWYETTRPKWGCYGVADVTLRLPETFYPCLPVRSVETEEIIYPYGVLRGAWTYPEIRQALADGAAIHQVHRAVEFERASKPFDAYVTYCYTERLRATNDVDRTFWKLMLNSLYGKFGQGHDGLLTIHDDRDLVPTNRKTPRHVNVIWSAYVTAYARLRLLEYLRDTGSRQVYYTDTDSLFTPRALPHGSALGELKQEGIYREAEYKGNKLYILDDRICKAKGIKGEAAKDFIRTGRGVFRRPARYREGRRTFARANVWYTVEKRLVKPYTKRRVVDPVSGWTEPWEWETYQAAMHALAQRSQGHVEPEEDDGLGGAIT